MTWKEENKTLRNDFEFKDFKTAFEFMTEVAKVADKMDHHPDWRNVYNRVEFTLSTHDAGNVVTEKDRRLAMEIDKIYQNFS